LLVSIIEGDPGADRDRLFRKWTQQMFEADGLVELAIDPEGYLWAVLRHTFANLLSSLDRDGRKRKQKQQTPEQRAKVQEDRQAKVEVLKQQVEQTVLLNLVLSNGKKIRDCTGAECIKEGAGRIKEGGWLMAIGKKVGKRLVGEVLSEKQIAALRK